MAEEVKKDEEIKVEEKVLSKIELGSDYTAKINVQLEDEKTKEKIDFLFKVHIPTMKEELKIAVIEDEILGIVSSNRLTNASAKIIATLEVAIDEIYIDEKKQDGTFWDMAKNIRQVGKFYKQVIFPAYEKFVEFQNSAEMDFEDLKKTLHSLGKK